MSDSKFKTLRHIETVRNYLGSVIKELLVRGEKHDQSKLEDYEVDIFDEFTPKLRDCTYGSGEYQNYLDEMKPALDHHYANNDHHPEHHHAGIVDMNLVQLIEMVCDWKAATLRHADGDIYKSIELNQKRFKYSDELKQILINTAHMLNGSDTQHKAEES